MKIMTVLGTRPEAIKLAPVVRVLQTRPDIEHVLCVTGQHRSMLHQVLKVFELKPNCDIDLMKPGQDLAHVTCSALQGVASFVKKCAPDWVIVQGDTTTAFSAALAAFYLKVKVAHVEAGLRSGDVYSPWPEEMNRKLVGAIASLHFAPTLLAAENLRAEGIKKDRICVTGNTVIDALQWMDARITGDVSLRAKLDADLPPLDPLRRIILVTGHRRENFDGGLEQICGALRILANRVDVDIVYPVHLNPRVQETAKRILANHQRIHLIPPLDYEHFVALMRRAYLIVTDSGGVQEEAPSFAKPVLVTRDTTERPEAIAAGTARLVGTDTDSVVAAATELLNDADAYAKMAHAENPFGDGRAAERIVDRILVAEP